MGVEIVFGCVVTGVREHIFRRRGGRREHRGGEHRGGRTDAGLPERYTVPVLKYNWRNHMEDCGDWVIS